MTPTVNIYDVGGFVRDHLLDIPSKDRDCTVVIEPAMEIGEAFDFLTEWLTEQGYVIFVSTPEHATIRAHQPERGTLPADFVLARTEGPYSDGRRPDWVRTGTLADDLARRDFTVNAMARPVGGTRDDIIDHHGGMADLFTMSLRFVGDPEERIREDALRVMRAIRFAVTKGFHVLHATRNAIERPWVPDLLARVSEERREAELRAMFAHASTTKVLQMLAALPLPLQEAMFSGRVRLTSTLRKRG